MVMRQGEGDGGRGIPSLASSSLSAILLLLTKAVKRRSWVEDKVTLTHLVHTHIPHNLRYELQKRVLREWRVYDTVSLRLLQVILSPATSSLRLVQVRAFYRDDLASLLQRLTGLRHLNIQDPGWALSGSQLQQVGSALTRMQHLRILVLQYCAHDLLLAAVASSCHHLQVVDVRGSRGVTDGGVWSLVMIPPPWDLTTTTTNKSSPHIIPRPPGSINSSSSSSRRDSGSSFITCCSVTFKQLTSRLKSFDIFSPQKSTTTKDKKKKKKKKRTVRRDSRTSWWWKEEEEEEEEEEDNNTDEDIGTYWEDTLTLSPCCSFLTSLDIRGTRVTHVGMEVLCQVLPTHTHIAHDPVHLIWTDAT